MNELEKQLDCFLLKRPTLGQRVYIARGAIVDGDVAIGDYSSIWHNAVLRGDINRIVVGHHSNVQDNSVLHLADEYPCIVGDYVTIGHSAIIHACSVGNETLVGMGAIIMDGVVIGEQSIIGAGALVTQGQQIPPGSMVLGSPAVVARMLSTAEKNRLKGFAEKYVAIAAYRLEHNK